MKAEINRRIERRKKARFAISRELRYKLVEDHKVVAQGAGETIDIGSGGIAFSAEHRLRAGSFVELSIAWPVLLDENTRMRLVVFGRVLRSHDQIAVCSVDKYEFRTQARLVQADVRGRQDTMLERWVAELRKDDLKERGASA